MLNIKNIVNIDTEAQTVIYSHRSMLWNSRRLGLGIPSRKDHDLV